MIRFKAILELLGHVTARLKAHVEGTGTAHDPNDEALLVAAKLASETFHLGSMVPIGTPIGISEEEVVALRHVQTFMQNAQFQPSTEDLWRLAQGVLDRLIASATGGAIVYPHQSSEGES